MKNYYLIILLLYILPAAGQDMVISNVNIIDVETGTIRQNMDVTLAKGKISSIRDHKKRRYSKNIQVIDGSGKYLSPGFIDSHAHVALGPVSVAVKNFKPVLTLKMDKSYAERTANLLLAFGITTSRDPGGLTEMTVGIKKAIAAGEIKGPELLVAGSIIDTLTFENLVSTVKSSNEIIAEIRKQKEAGVDFIKLYTSLSPEFLKVGVDETRRQGLKSISHLHTTSWTQAANLGLDNIVHIIPGSDLLLPASKREEYNKYAKFGAIAFYKWFELVDLEGAEINEMLEALSRNKVSIDPTLVPFHAAFFGNKNLYQTNSYLKYMPEEFVTNWKTTFNFNLGWKEKDFKVAQESWPKVEKFVRMLHQKGIMLTAGTDANNPWIVPGDSFHTELKLLADCGLTNAEVLKIATLNGAKLMNIDNRVGKIEKGYEADLVLLNANPLAEISNTRQIASIFLDGEIIDSGAMLKSMQ